MGADLLTWLSLAGTPLLLGGTALRWIGVRWSDDRLAFVPWAYAAGTLVVALILWAATWLHVPLEPASALPLLPAAALLWWLSRRRHPAAKDAGTVPADGRAGRLLLTAAVLIALAVSADRIALSTAQLVAETDEATIWAAKAKVIHAAGGFNAAFRAATDPEARPFLHHADYPLLNPLLQLWVFIHRGGIVHLENRLPIQLYAPALLLLAAAALRRVVRGEVAAALVLALAGGPTTRMLTLHAYADHMVAFGWLLGLDAWLRYTASRDARWWRLAMIGVTFALWSKNEGMMLAATALLAVGVPFLLSLSRQRGTSAWGAALARSGLPPRPGDLLWGLLPIGVAVAHFAANHALGFGNDLFAASAPGPLWSLVASQFADRAPQVAAFAARSAIEAPVSISLMPAAFLFLTLLFPRRLWRSDLRTPALSLGLAMTCLLAVYVGSYHPLRWHLETSFGRVVYQVTPALGLWLGAFAATLWPSLRPGGRYGPPSRRRELATED